MPSPTTRHLCVSTVPSARRCRGYLRAVLSARARWPTRWRPQSAVWLARGLFRSHTTVSTCRDHVSGRSYLSFQLRMSTSVSLILFHCCSAGRQLFFEREHTAHIRRHRDRQRPRLFQRRPDVERSGCVERLQHGGVGVGDIRGMRRLCWIEQRRGSGRGHDCASDGGHAYRVVQLRRWR